MCIVRSSVDPCECCALLFDSNRFYPAPASQHRHNVHASQHVCNKKGDNDLATIVLVVGRLVAETCPRSSLLAPLFRRLQTALEASERRLSATAPVMRLILRTVHSSARQNIEQVRDHLYATHQGAPIDRSFTTLSGCSFSLCHSRIYNILWL